MVELKRDKAPDTVEMQALKYAALVSRFTREDLDRVHSRYLSRGRADRVTMEEAAAALDEWAEITEESLRLPRLILMATEFPQTVTATVVFLHQQLGLDIRLLAFQAYRTANDVLLTVSQHYPPAGIEEFILSPQVNEVQQAKNTRQSKQREASTVARLLAAAALPADERLEFKAPSPHLQQEINRWLDEQPGRRYATWQEDATAPLMWEADGRAYSPTELARVILEEGAGRTSAVQGPAYWFTAAGQSLLQLAQGLPPATKVTVEEHVARLAPILVAPWEALRQSIKTIGADVTESSMVRSIAYFRSRLMCDVLFHRDHISLYIRGLSGGEFPPGGVVVAGRPDYIHAHVRDLDDVGPAVDLVRRSYQRQRART